MLARCDAAELVTQVLFGELFHIVETNDKWSLIRLEHDHYECWIDNKQWDELSDEYEALGYLIEALVELRFDVKKAHAIFAEHPSHQSDVAEAKSRKRSSLSCKARSIRLRSVIFSKALATRFWGNRKTRIRNAPLSRSSA